MSAVDAAADFHLGLARLGGNKRAERILAGLVDDARPMNYLSPALARRVHEEAELKDHRDLVDAMPRRDVERAHEVMERHSRESLRQKLAGLAEI